MPRRHVSAGIRKAELRRLEADAEIFKRYTYTPYVRGKRQATEPAVRKDGKIKRARVEKD